MKNILVEIKCNRCFYHTHIKSHTFVLPDLEPNLRKRILSGKMFSYICPRCQQEIQFIHPFLYHDKHHRFLIVMSQEDKNLQELQEQFPHTKVRLVKGIEQLMEHIRMFEDGLEDERIIQIKRKLCIKYTEVKEIVYRDYDISSNSLWFTFTYENGEVDVKGIDKSIYDTIVEGRM